MITLVPASIETYAQTHTTDPGQLFKELAEEAHRSTGAPGMMSGPTVGWVLNTLIYASGAKRVLEIGTFVGYSALMMASALPEDGELVTCDIDEHATSIARRFWERSPHGKKIRLELAPAAETMERLKGTFDLVFIDADKPGYPVYYEKALGMLSDRGVIVLDNMLRGGSVLDPVNEDARVIAELNRRIASDERVVNVLLMVRDGLMLVHRQS